MRNTFPLSFICLQFYFSFPPFQFTPLFSSVCPFAACLAAWGERQKRAMKDDSFLEEQITCPLTDEEIELRRWELQNALVELSQRGLKKGAKWVAELLMGLPQGKCTAFVPPERLYVVSEEELFRQEEEKSMYLIGKSFFDCGEYRRCANFMERGESAKSRFLCVYSLFLHGEKRKEEEMLENSETPGGITSENSELSAFQLILNDISRLQSPEDYESDPFLLYLYGVFARRLRQLELAKVLLRKSVEIFPWNWSAWMELFRMDVERGVAWRSGEDLDMEAAVYAERMRRKQETEDSADVSSVVGSIGPLRTTKSPVLSPPSWAVRRDRTRSTDGITFSCPTRNSEGSHWMWRVYDAYWVEENQQDPMLAVQKYEDIKQEFPYSPYILSQLALSNYNIRAFEEVEDIYDRLEEIDPFRLDGLEVFSNILYVKDNRRELGNLAHRAHLIDKMRPETCLVVGNYYSLRQMHEKAALYFRRGIQLDRHYLSAWTLLGHEYVEMKNTAMAVQAYRQAVDINPMEYRAWYGLGQTYELLHKPLYAIFYFRRAVALRPYDGRMWLALGQCFEYLQRLSEASQCYGQAASTAQPELTALVKLARIVIEMKDHDRGIILYHKWADLVKSGDIPNPSTNELCEAYERLARGYLKRGNMEEAENFALLLMDQGPMFQGVAKDILKQISEHAGHPEYTGDQPSAASDEDMMIMDIDSPDET
eukprot:TRINITY_DN1034_c0_g1_i1.p1 TRINITY_DN1034_c0_g1~~TRINITY_DN1034_c0_g1_i1.p1  ORF type:complete len:710 (+),score=177.81 TRINITY_DN1034_c0_g1_i1:16-2145(+)